MYHTSHASDVCMSLMHVTVCYSYCYSIKCACCVGVCYVCVHVCVHCAHDVCIVCMVCRMRAWNVLHGL